MIYGYARMSTAKQADDGESLEVQQRMMTGYGLIHGIEIGRTFIERGVVWLGAAGGTARGPKAHVGRDMAY